MSVFVWYYLTLSYYIFHCLCPGKSPVEGAQTTLHCCLAESLEPGGYYVDCTLRNLPRWASTKQQLKLWKKSNELLGIQNF